MYKKKVEKMGGGVKSEGGMVWAFGKQHFSTSTIYQIVLYPNFGLYCKKIHS